MSPFVMSSESYKKDCELQSEQKLQQINSKQRKGFNFQVNKQKMATSVINGSLFAKLDGEERTFHRKNALMYRLRTGCKSGYSSPVFQSPQLSNLDSRQQLRVPEFVGSNSPSSSSSSSRTSSTTSLA